MYYTEINSFIGNFMKYENTSDHTDAVNLFTYEKFKIC